MTRNLKMLGLALSAVLAMSAVVAGTAQAQNGIFGPALTLDATTSQKIGESNEYYEQIGRKIECEMVHFHGMLIDASETLTLTPDYTDESQGGTCDTGGIFKTSITENGCDYVFHTAGTDGAHYKVGMDIVCSEGGSIIMHVANGAGVDACTITIGSHTTDGMLTAENNEGHVDLSGSVEVTSTLHSKSAGICGKAVGEHKGIVTKYVINDPITMTVTDGLVISD